MLYFSILDLDECALGTAGCEQMCKDTEGSFVCSCYEGFELLGDSVSCNASKLKKRHLFRMFTIIYKL